MNKKKVLAILLALAMTLCLAACGSDSGDSDNAGGDTATETTDSSAAEDTADEDAAEASQGDLLEEFEFTKSVMNQDLEKPFKVCALKFDENEDLKSEDNLNQERESLHLHISILEVGCDVEAQFEKCRSDNVDYVTSSAHGYNVQQADAVSDDGSAKFNVVRYTNFEDDEENDYKYMADLVYTDGTNAAATEFMYSIDKEYGNGDEVEAEMKAITDYYGIDYANLEWVDVED